MRLEIVIVSHKGELEIQTLILVQSIRKYLHGTFNINIAIPTNIDSPASETIELLKHWDCRVFYFENRFLKELKRDLIPGDLVSNKIFALEFFQTKNPVLFLDSDTCLINTIHSNEFLKSELFMAKPANRANVLRWNEIYNYFNFRVPEVTITTGVDKRKIPPYFNAGVLYFTNEVYKNIIPVWCDLFLQLSEESILKKEYFSSFNRDQVALSLALTSTKTNYEELDENLNFPVNAKKISPNNQTKLVHYHSPFVFYLKDFLKQQLIEIQVDYPFINKLFDLEVRWKRLFLKPKIVTIYFIFKFKASHTRTLLKFAMNRLFRMFKSR